MMRWIKRLFEDAAGVPSSKRIQSFGLLTVAVIMALKGCEVALVGVLLGAALALQGITAFQK